LRLPEGEAHHLRDVLRLRPGARVAVFDGAGSECECTVPEGRADDGSLCLARIPGTLVRDKPLPDVTLLQAVLKGPRMDLFIEKAAELGARRIVPVTTARSIVKLTSAQAEERVARWKRITLSAAKQCGSRWIPDITAVRPLGAALERGLSAGICMVGALTGEIRPLHDVFESATPESSASVLIGPEGDLTADELSQAVSAGFVPVSFGPRVLRAETAGLFALSVVQYELLRER